MHMHSTEIPDLELRGVAARPREAKANKNLWRVGGPGLGGSRDTPRRVSHFRSSAAVPSPAGNAERMTAKPSLIRVTLAPAARTKNADAP